MNFKKIEITSIKLLSLNFYKVVLKYLYNGYSECFANMIRRILLTSVHGYGVTEVKIQGINNEYDLLFGVKEDILNILLNIKGIVFKLKNKKFVILELKEIGPCVVKAKNILLNKNIKIINPNHIIAHLSKNAKLHLKLIVRKGLGYICYNSNKKFKFKSFINGILLDVCFCPVYRVFFNIKKSKFNNMDKVNFFIETNGCFNGKQIFKKSMKFFLKQFSNFNI